MFNGMNVIWNEMVEKFLHALHVIYHSKILTHKDRWITARFLLVVVQLLLGNIDNRFWFRPRDVESAKSFYCFAVLSSWETAEWQLVVALHRNRRINPICFGKQRRLGRSNSQLYGRLLNDVLCGTILCREACWLRLLLVEGVVGWEWWHFVWWVLFLLKNCDGWSGREYEFYWFRLNL